MRNQLKKKIRVIAFYLPQFHLIPENDAWWGKGFTEWTNVGKAKALFWGHYQPKVPADLGYYDLRVPETRIAQADLAREAGIEGFCYWHYWFGNGKRLLDRPLNEVVQSGEPNYPFCLGWANHSWEVKTWTAKDDGKLLIKQTYPGVKDYTNHFNAILVALKDKRYITVENKPLFLIWAPLDFPDADIFINLWNDLAKKNGLAGVYFVAFSKVKEDTTILLEKGFDAVTLDLMAPSFYSRKKTIKVFNRILRFLFSISKVMDYRTYAKYYIEHFEPAKEIIPCIVPNYDHSPRSGVNALIYTNSTPQNFEKLLKKLFFKIKSAQKTSNLVFIKSWNEWGEGNYLEPDLKYGTGYLNALKRQLEE